MNCHIPPEKDLGGWKSNCEIADGEIPLEVLFRSIRAETSEQVFTGQNGVRIFVLNTALNLCMCVSVCVIDQWWIGDCLCFMFSNLPPC